MLWITEQVLIAGAGITENNWQEVVDLGITAVVNLRTENQDVFGVPPPLAYLWLPTEDHTDPSPEQLLLGAQLIHTLVKNGHRVLIHCKMGIHRSATMVVAYLIYSGMEKEEAIWQLRKMVLGCMEQKKIIGRSMSSFSLCQNDSSTNGSVFQARKLVFRVVAQHSVHPTGGSLRVFKQVSGFKSVPSKWRCLLRPPAGNANR